MTLQAKTLKRRRSRCLKQYHDQISIDIQSTTFSEPLLESCHRLRYGSPSALSGQAVFLFCLDALHARSPGLIAQVPGHQEISTWFWTSPRPAPFPLMVCSLWRFREAPLRQDGVSAVMTSSQYPLRRVVSPGGWYKPSVDIVLDSLTLSGVVTADVPKTTPMGKLAVRANEEGFLKQGFWRFQATAFPHGFHRDTAH